MSWANTGETSEKEFESQTSNNTTVRSFFGELGKTKRIIFLDEHPARFYEHSLYLLGKAKATPICLDKNGNLSQTHGRCPFCESTQRNIDTNGKSGYLLHPRYVGYLSVIDCGDVTFVNQQPVLTGYMSKRQAGPAVEYIFGRKLIQLKSGSASKPGTLRRLEKHRARRGKIMGSVWDLTRSGAKDESIGIEWEYVGHIDVSSPESIKKGLHEMSGIQERHHEMIDKMTEFEPIDYMSHFVPEKREDLMRFFGYAEGDSYKPNYGGSKQPNAFENSETSTTFDDDVPF